jgi:lytic murein transglycosylase
VLDTRASYDAAKRVRRRCVRPVAVLLALFVASLCVAAPRTIAQSADDFRRFVQELWPEAQGMGVSRATFDAAFRGVEPDLSIPDLVLAGQGKEVKGQAEFTRTPAEYLTVSHLARLTEQGRSLLTQRAADLTKIEQAIGVQRNVVLAIWGRETAFGAHRSPHYAVQVLATQAWLGRRKEMFRTELLYALKMLEDKVRTRETMNASWAGAMGLTQFMPSEFYTVAYDLDGDGRKDIWGSVGDALASAANQLKAKGWVSGQSWGYEVRLPPSLNCLAEGQDRTRPLREWIKAGVVRTRGREFPADVQDAPAFVLTPAGAYGPAFLVLENFLVIKRYNMSDLYALFVGDLSDRIAGGGDFETPWGSVRQLSAKSVEQLQERMQGLGYAVAKVDGKAGMNTRALVGAYQKTNNLKVDCWPSEAVLTHMRGTGVKGPDPGKSTDSDVTRGKSGLGVQ